MVQLYKLKTGWQLTFLVAEAVVGRGSEEKIWIIVGRWVWLAFHSGDEKSSVKSFNQVRKQVEHDPIKKLHSKQPLMKTPQMILLSLTLD